LPLFGTDDLQGDFHLAICRYSFKYCAVSYSVFFVAPLARCESHRSCYLFQEQRLEKFHLPLQNDPLDSRAGYRETCSDNNKSSRSRRQQIKTQHEAQVKRFRSDNALEYRGMKQAAGGGVYSSALSLSRTYAPSIPVASSTNTAIHFTPIIVDRPSTMA